MNYEDAYIALGALTKRVSDSQGELRAYRAEVEALKHRGVNTIQNQEAVNLHNHQQTQLDDLQERTREQDKKLVKFSTAVSAMQEELEKLREAISGNPTVHAQYQQTGILPDVEQDLSLRLQQGWDILDDIDELRRQLSDLHLAHLAHVKNMQSAENVGTMLSDLRDRITELEGASRDSLHQEIRDTREDLMQEMNSRLTEAQGEMTVSMDEGMSEMQEQFTAEIQGMREELATGLQDVQEGVAGLRDRVEVNAGDAVSGATVLQAFHNMGNLLTQCMNNLTRRLTDFENHTNETMGAVKVVIYDLCNHVRALEQKVDDTLSTGVGHREEARQKVQTTHNELTIIKDEIAVVKEQVANVLFRGTTNLFNASRENVSSFGTGTNGGLGVSTFLNSGTSSTAGFNLSAGNGNGGNSGMQLMGNGESGNGNGGNGNGGNGGMQLMGNLESGNGGMQLMVNSHGLGTVFANVGNSELVGFDLSGHDG